MDILTISQYILTVGGAVVIILLAISLIISILIWLKLYALVKDMKYRYDLAVGMLFKPFEFVNHLLNKFK